MAKKARLRAVEAYQTGTATHIDCACLFHGTGYEWQYVDRLYSMLCRNLSLDVRLHVYTEAGRTVPAPYIKHDLIDWGFGGPKKSWWYKMQLFNIQHHNGPLLYFDLDTVITKNIDWIWQLPLSKFWTVRDFKHIWRPTTHTINSSVMWWDTGAFSKIWNIFQNENLPMIMKKYPGDQDYLTAVIETQRLRFFALENIKSWRWQCLDGGFDFKTRKWKNPGSGTVIEDTTSVLVFHGEPKPHSTQDPVIVEHWK
jgi:alpha-N-acetylglucosamine transferase